MKLSSKTVVPRLGYMLRTFPVLSETFVANEILEVSRLTGQSPVVAALHRPGPGQAGGAQAIDPADLRYWPDIDKRRLGDVALAHVRLLSAAPVRTVKAVSRPGPEGLPLKDRIKAASLAVFFLDRGVGHLHSHFGWEQADMLAYLQRLSGLPYSLTLHAADIFMDGGDLARRLHGASFVATISKYNKDFLVNRFGPLNGKIHVVHCGVDIGAYEASPIPETRPVRVVSVGRMVSKKGFDILLQALALLRAEGLELGCDLVGDGPLRAELELLAVELGLANCVRFHGALPPEKTSACVREGHVFALACRVGENGDMDGIPVALMEAMALGRPVVSTNLSGIPELLADDCGLLAEPGEWQSLAAQLRHLALDWDHSRRLAANARRKIEQEYTLRIQAGRIVELSTLGSGGREQ